MSDAKPDQKSDPNDPENVPGGGVDPDDLHDGSGPGSDTASGGDDDQFQG